MNIEMNVTLTPEQIANAFWNLGSDGQVAFFAELDRVAGFMLCMQMAGVVHDMAQIDTETQSRAMNGFRTMLMHAATYAESATEFRSATAKGEIAGLVRDAKRAMQ